MLLSHGKFRCIFTNNWHVEMWSLEYIAPLCHFVQKLKIISPTVNSPMLGRHTFKDYKKILCRK